jgi:hypothetical protein
MNVYYLQPWSIKSQSVLRTYTYIETYICTKHMYGEGKWEHNGEGELIQNTL